MNILVNGAVLKSYRVNRNIKLPKLSRYTGLPQNLIEKYENSDNEISQEELEKFAKAFKVSWLAFLDDEPEKPVNYGHDNRSTSNQQEKLDVETLKVLDDTKDLLDIASDTMPDSGFSLDGFEVKINNPEYVAKMLRAYLKVNSKDIKELKDPYEVLRYWKEIFNNRGLYIFERSWSTKSVRAFSLVNGTQAAAVLSTKDTPFGRIFSLLHEVYHIINKQPGICDLHLGANQDIEVLCNRFAAAFLMPDTEFTNYAEAMGLSKDNKDTATEGDVLMLRKYFKTSRLSVYRRLLTLGYITKGFYQKVQDEYEDIAPNNEGGGGNYYRNKINEVGKKYALDLISAYSNDRISARTLAQILNVRVTHLPEINNMVGNSGNSK